jgi:sulfatase modifying factor 1
MAGNVSEWVSDFYDPTYFTQAAVNDPQGPKGGVEHVVKGGAFNGAAKHLRISVREHKSKADNTTGFRCVVPTLP